MGRVEVVAKPLVGAAGVVVLAGALSIVPPLERPAPGPPDGVAVPFGTAVTAPATVVLAGLFPVIADELESLVAERLPGSDPLVADAGAVVKHLVVFLALVASYGPLAGVVSPPGIVRLLGLPFVLVTLLSLTAPARGRGPGRPRVAPRRGRPFGERARGAGHRRRVGRGPQARPVTTARRLRSRATPPMAIWWRRRARPSSRRSSSR